MATTAIFAEILIIGLQAGVWLALLVASIFGTEFVPIQGLGDWQYLIILFVVAIAYVLGILIDRAADTVFLVVLKVRDEFAKGCKKKKAVKRRKLNEAAKRVKLNVLEKFAEIFRAIKTAIRGKSKKEERPTFGEMRLQILMQNDAVAKFLDYQRSRLRVARATAFNLFLIIVTGIVFLFTRTDFSTSTIAWSAFVGIVLLALSLYAALRIEKAQTKNLKKAYDMIADRSSQRVATICYRRVIRGIEFLLVRTRDGLRWTFPKGHIQEGESPEQAAEREAKEEAGVIGKVSAKPVAEYLFPLQGSGLRTKKEKVTAFLLEVTTEINKHEKGRDPTWFRSREVKKKLAERREREFTVEHERVVDAAVEEIKRSLDEQVP